jgi:tol-pal system protein YbgF
MVIKASLFALSSVLLFLVLTVSLTGCGLRRGTASPASVDMAGSDMSDETLRTLIVSLNNRYENVDGRIVQNQKKIEALERELVLIREGLGVLRPASRPRPTEGPNRRPDEISREKSSRPTNAPVDAKGLYDRAFAAYSRRDYQTAISQFQEFLSAFPSSDLADNAFYWIGESYYGKEDFERGIASFLKLVDRYPHGNKVPDALFKIGLSYSRLQSREKAIEFLTRVMDNYPFSSAAEKAKIKLDQLK